MKYVVVIPYGDELPETCFDCRDCQQIAFQDRHECGWLNKTIKVDVCEARPEWCPIVESKELRDGLVN